MADGDSTRGRGRPVKTLAPAADALGRFGAHVRAGRNNSRIKQNELAALLGCSPSSLSQIERGVLRPGPVLAEALDHILAADGLLLSLFRDAQDEQDRKKSVHPGRPRLHDGSTPSSSDPEIADLELIPGDLSLWVQDVTVPDGSLMAPGERFVKI